MTSAGRAFGLTLTLDGDCSCPLTAMAVLTQKNSYYAAVMPGVAHASLGAGTRISTT